MAVNSRSLLHFEYSPGRRRCFSDFCAIFAIFCTLNKEFLNTFLRIFIVRCNDFLRKLGENRPEGSSVMANFVRYLPDVFSKSDIGRYVVPIVQTASVSPQRNSGKPWVISDSTKKGQTEKIIQNRQSSKV